jgi:hypothetical protein
MLCILVDKRPTNMPTWIWKKEDQLTDRELNLFKGAFESLNLPPRFPQATNHQAIPLRGGPRIVAHQVYTKSARVGLEYICNEFIRF